MLIILRKITPAFILKQSARFSKENIEDAARMADKIHKKCRKTGPLRRFFNDVGLMIAMLRDYLSGRYRDVPYWAITAIAFTLLYVLNPFDLIPDYLPLIGYLDDAAVVAACLVLVRQQLADYQRWRGRDHRKMRA